MFKEHIFIGIDSSYYRNFLVVLDKDGNKITSFGLSNDHQGCQTLINRLNIIKDEFMQTPVVGFECRNGHMEILTSYLNKTPFILKSLQPIEVKRHKDYFTQPTKTDEYDAYIIADYLRVKLSRLRQIDKTINPNIKALKELSCLYKDFAKQKTRYTNKLHQVLIESFPEYITEGLFSKLTCRSSLMLLANYPTPLELKKLSVKELTKLLEVNSRGHLKEDLAERILDLVNSLPQLDRDYDILSFRVSSLAKTILTLDDQLKTLKIKMKHYMKDLKEAKIVNSLPGSDTVLTARFLGAIESVNKFKSSNGLGLYCGVAPLNDKSGKRNRTKRAFRVNRLAKDALMQIAAASIRSNAKSRAFYERKIKEGKRHWQAVKALARHIVRVLYVMLKNETEYNPIIQPAMV